MMWVPDMFPSIRNVILRTLIKVQESPIISFYNKPIISNIHFHPPSLLQQRGGLGGEYM
jgi:hypothetical protein